MHIRATLDRYPPTWLILFGILAFGYGMIRITQIGLAPLWLMAQRVVRLPLSGRRWPVLPFLNRNMPFRR